MRRQEAHGFQLHQDSLRVDSYRLHRFHKEPRRGKPVRFSTLEMSGMLTVTDAARLTTTLFNGIGPGKGYGCGLLLVRRV